MNSDSKQPDSESREARHCRRWLFAWLCLVALGTSTSACSSKENGTQPALGKDCDGRAESVSAGMTKVSEQGYRFQLSQLEPSVPVQSDSPPGNHWTVTISDPNGDQVTGATLAINTYMPDHGHSGPPAVAVETGEGNYDVLDLVFPMPTLYSVSLLLTLPSGDKQTATLMLCLDADSG